MQMMIAALMLRLLNIKVCILTNITNGHMQYLTNGACNWTQYMYSIISHASQSSVAWPAQSTQNSTGALGLGVWGRAFWVYKRVYYV